MGKADEAVNEASSFVAKVQLRIHFGLYPAWIATTDTFVNYMYSVCVDYYNTTISHLLAVINGSAFIIPSLSRKESSLADISRIHWSFPPRAETGQRLKLELQTAGL